MKRVILVMIVVLISVFWVSAQSAVGNPFAVPSDGASPVSSVPAPSVSSTSAKTSGSGSEIQIQLHVQVPAEIMEYLTAPKELAGCIVHGDYDGWKLSKKIGEDGKTDIPLKEGWLYILEKDSSHYFYPNGDACIAWWTYAKYLGGGKWLNTCDLTKEQPPEAKNFKPYEVKWPK